MNSEMITYYCEIGGVPHRFKAVNKYAAQQVAKVLALSVGVRVWTDPVRYCEFEHGKHFNQEWVA